MYDTEELSSFQKTVLITIVAHLDCNSIRALLIAVDFLRPLALVVKDTNETPVFFDIPEVQQLTLQEFLSSNDGDPPLFKLFEVSLTNRGIRDLFIQHSPQFLDEASFVHYYEGIAHLYCYPEHSPFEILGIHQSKYSLSFTRPFSKPCVGPATLIQLSLSDTLYVEDLEFPCLLRLSINFYKDTQNTIPLVRNIRTPSLRSFSIHYSGRLPLIYNINCSQDKRVQWQDDDFSSVFELCNTNGMDLKKHIISEDTFQYLSYRRLNLSFTEVFSIHQYIGVPDIVISTAYLRRCRSLHWIHTIEYTHESSAQISKDTLISLPRTLNLLYTTSIPDSYIPLFKCPKLLTLNLFITSPNVSLNNILSYETTSTLCSLNITCHLPQHLLDETSHTTLFTTHLQAIFSLPYLKHLTLRGCLLDHGNKYLYAPFPLTLHTPPPLQKIILEIVKLNGESTHLIMRTFESVSLQSLKLIKLSQETRGDQWESVNVVLSHMEEMEELIVETDDSFAYAEVNGELVDLWETLRSFKI